MDRWADWRWWVLVYIVCSALWGLLAKVASTRLNTLTQSFLAVTSASLVVAIAACRSLEWRSPSGIVAAVTAGILGGTASIAFYAALRQAPASIVIPLTSLYLVPTVVLSWMLLGETIGLRQVAGIAFGLVAIALLAK